MTDQRKHTAELVDIVIKHAPSRGAPDWVICAVSEAFVFGKQVQAEEMVAMARESMEEGEE